jgi:hypothetical protein
MRPRWITQSGLALALVGVVGCSRAAVRAEPAQATAQAKTEVDAGALSGLERAPVDASSRNQVEQDLLGNAKAWTDPSAIDALASDCSVALSKSDAVDDGARTSPLTCSLEWEQSCSHDPCYEKGQECHAACATTCDGCGTQCATTCGSCKSACAAGAAGDACRRACATTTGSCRQACLQTRDKCASAACTRAEAACEVEERRKWKAAGCTGKCPAIDACYMKCADAKEDDAEKCRGLCQKRWPGCDMMYCVMGSPPEPRPVTP